MPLRWWIPRWGAAWPFHTGHNCLASHLSWLQPVSALLFLQFKVNIPLLATEIFWNREDHNVRKSLILSDTYDLVSSTFHMPLYEALILICFKAKLAKGRKGPLPKKIAPPPSLSNVWTSLHTYPSSNLPFSFGGLQLFFQNAVMLIPSPLLCLEGESVSEEICFLRKSSSATLTLLFWLCSAKLCCLVLLCGSCIRCSS